MEYIKTDDQSNVRHMTEIRILPDGPWQWLKERFFTDLDRSFFLRSVGENLRFHFPVRTRKIRRYVGE